MTFACTRKCKVNSLVSLHVESEWVTVLVIDLPVMGYHPEDQQTRNCVAVQLLKAELVTLPEAVVSFGIPRSTLRDARQRFQEQGVRGLIPAKSDPKGAWKEVFVVLHSQGPGPNLAPTPSQSWPYQISSQHFFLPYTPLSVSAYRKSLPRWSP